jgi:hypothetical protein
MQPCDGFLALGESLDLTVQNHAAIQAITVPLYKNKDAVMVEAPLPGHMREALAAFG